jgi:hypothetical protein
MIRVALPERRVCARWWRWFTTPARLDPPSRWPVRRDGAPGRASVTLADRGARRPHAEVVASEVSMQPIKSFGLGLVVGLLIEDLTAAVVFIAGGALTLSIWDIFMFMGRKAD